MARDVEITQSKPTQRTHYGINKEPFYRGVIDLINRTELPMSAVWKAYNLIQIENGYYTKRPGTEYYGTASTYTLDGGGVHYASGSVPHLLRVANGTVQRSLDDGATWDNCTGATLTAGKKCVMLQGGFEDPQTWIVNGYDGLIRYDGTTTLVAYSALSTPTGLSAAQTGMTGTTYTHYYTCSAVNAVGFTAAPTATSVQSTEVREDFSATKYVTVSCTAVSGAERYDWYYGDSSGKQYWIGSSATNTYKDIGGQIVYTVTPPVDNTTDGPVFGDIEYSDNRIWGAKDPSNPYRVYWAGSGAWAGYFSPYYGGGWIDLEPGSAATVEKIKHYRDGKGTSYATVWTKDPDNMAGIWQIGLTTKLSDSGLSYVEPSAFKLPGSRGTVSQFSVVEILNDILFMNRDGLYALRSKQQLLNLLATDELTSGIRNFLKRLNQSAIDKVCAIAHNYKVYISIPIDGSTTNNRIMVYDLERRNLTPEAFDYGVERFFDYTDTDGTRRLLGWLPDGKQFIEISENFEGDFGQTIPTKLETGIMHTTQDRFSFFKARDIEFEFTDTKGDIIIEVDGYEKKKGYSTLLVIEINGDSRYAGGWSNFLWSFKQWSATTAGAASIFGLTTKKYQRINKEINNFGFTVKTDNFNSNYTGPRVLQVYGKPTRSKKPSNWKAQRR